MNLEGLYQDIILEHHKRPHHSGLREPFDSEVYHHNPTCGDSLTLRVNVGDGVIKDVSYDAQGCSISVASASMMTDLVVGETIDVALQRFEAMREMLQSRGQAEPDEDELGDAVALVGVGKFPARVKCAMLGWSALRDALAQSE